MLFLVPVATYWIGSYLSLAFTDLREVNIVKNDELLNSFLSPSEINLMDAVPIRVRKYRFVADLVMKYADKASLILVYNRYLNLLLILLYQIIIVLSAIKYSTDSPNIAANLITAMLLVPLLFFQITKLQLLYAGIMDITPYLYAFYGIMTHHNNIECGPDNLSLTHAPEIEIEKLSFGYESKLFVLREFSALFFAGKTTALVSKSGGGKSTLLKLLCRLYDSQTGKIFIDGVSIQNFSCSSIRKNILYISQFPLFIKGTVRDNFHLLYPNAEDVQIESACRATGIYDLMQFDAIPLLDHQLTLGANNLSGGQRKLFALARAMLADSKVLLLDEPTTGVDSDTIANYIVPCVEQLRQNRTVILVDHNMNFVLKLTDNIVVIDNGCVSEFGSSEYILEKENSLFRDLWTEYNKTVVSM